MVESPFADRFIRARHYRVGSLRKIYWIVLHSAEVDAHVGASSAVANFFAQQPFNSAVQSSATYVVGGTDDETIQCVLEADIPFAAAGANEGGIHVEQTGFAAWTWAQWLAAGVPQKTAPLVACAARRHELPLDFIDEEGLLALEPGVTDHWRVTLAVRLAKKRGLIHSPFYTVEHGHHDTGWNDAANDEFIDMARSALPPLAA